MLKGYLVFGGNLLKQVEQPFKPGALPFKIPTVTDLSS